MARSKASSSFCCSASGRSASHALRQPFSPGLRSTDRVESHYPQTAPRPRKTRTSMIIPGFASQVSSKTRSSRGRAALLTPGSGRSRAAGLTAGSTCRGPTSPIDRLSRSAGRPERVHVSWKVRAPRATCPPVLIHQKGRRWQTSWQWHPAWATFPFRWTYIE